MRSVVRPKKKRFSASDQPIDCLFIFSIILRMNGLLCCEFIINHMTAENQVVYSLLPKIQPIESCLCS